MQSELPRIFEIPVRRNHLFEDSHRAIMSCKNRDHLKTRLWVKFDGEKGLDYGGVSRYVLTIATPIGTRFTAVMVICVYCLLQMGEVFIAVFEHKTFSY